MKAKILDINGKEKGSVDLPKCFSADVREDVVAKVLEVKKSEQPFAPSLVAGMQSSASGSLIHRRHVWKSQYGRGMSRVPRKTMTRKGSQFNWTAATAPSTVGGRRSHPPKVLARINTSKINKRELKVALCSAISATANENEVVKKYARLKKVDTLPFVVESKLTSLKVKDLLASMKKILGKDLFAIGMQKKTIRSGLGKMRGRKYKRNAGMLMVIGNEEKMKVNAFDVARVKDLGVTDLAKGGLGRLTVYTENAIKDLGVKLK